MRAPKGSIGRTLDQPPADIRLYLLYGPDEGQSRALGERLLKSLGASRLLIASGALRSDPAMLVDEASALNLFGGRRAIWVEPAGEEVTPAVEALLAAPAVESPVVLIGGALRASSALLKLADGSPAALSHPSYVPEGNQAERMVSEVGRTFGLRIAGPVAARIAEACGGDQSIVAREVEKLALYAGASPERPKELEQGALDAVGAALPEGDFLQLADLALSGDARALGAELAHLSAGGSEAIPVIRSLQRRLLMLAPIRARVERGESPSAVLTSLGKSLFWRDKERVEVMVARWDSAGIATLFERASRLERQLMLSAVPAAAALGEELTAVARKAASRRR